MSEPAWLVLLIGGPSGAGKSTAAAAIGRQFGIPWLQVDDLRLALQSSRVTLPERTDDLVYFLRADVWRESPEVLRDALVRVGEVMAPAIEVVIDHHVTTRTPIVIEGDGILPALAERPPVARRLADGRVRVVFVTEDDERRLLLNYRARGRGPDNRSEVEIHRHMATNALFSRWIAEDAGARDLMVMPSRPFETLTARVLGQ